MWILEHAALVLTVFTSVFSLFAFVYLWQLKHNQYAAHHESKDAEAEIWTWNILRGWGLAGNDDLGNKDRGYGRSYRVESLGKGHAERALLWRTKHHDVGVGNVLKHHDTHSYKTHGAKEHGIDIGTGRDSCTDAK